MRLMTVRVLGVDVEDDATSDPRPTPAEQLLLSQVVALAERQNRAVRLLIVPARDVFDAIATAMHRLRSSEIHVGESTTLPADGQARLLGEAWERLELEQALDVRLVIHHPSGRADVFYLGVHAPALSSRDLNQIHRLWLDAAKAVGSHVHHHEASRKQPQIFLGRKMPDQIWLRPIQKSDPFGVLASWRFNPLPVTQAFPRSGCRSRIRPRTTTSEI